MLAFVDLEERVPTDHPLRTIKVVADEALERLSAEFDRMYSKVDLRRLEPIIRAEAAVPTTIRRRFCLSSK